jgi:hypothetical protein
MNTNPTGHVATTDMTAVFGACDVRGVAPFFVSQSDIRTVGHSPWTHGICLDCQNVLRGRTHERLLPLV